MPATRPARSAVRAAVRGGLADLDPGDRVLVALSGGSDSLALLAATVLVAAERGLLSGAVVIDHGLQAESAHVAQRAAEQARILGCADVRVVPVSVARGAGSGGVEAAARAARYAALEHEASGAGSGGPPAAAVLLGHTRDDQAETVLLGLARGSGTRSVAGMSARAGLYRRPLLDLPRSVVAQAAAQAAGEDPRLAPWTDPHNADPSFARVRVRTDALPALERTLGPGVVEALARTAALARQDADALDAWADRVWAALCESGAAGTIDGRHGTSVRAGGDEGTRARADVVQEEGDVVAVVGVADLTGGADGPDALPAAIRTRLVQRFLRSAGCPPGALSAQHILGVTDLLEGPATRAEVALPGGRRARRERGALVVRA